MTQELLLSVGLRFGVCVLTTGFWLINKWFENIFLRKYFFLWNHENYPTTTSVWPWYMMNFGIKCTFVRLFYLVRSGERMHFWSWIVSTVFFLIFHRLFVLPFGTARTTARKTKIHRRRAPVISIIGGFSRSIIRKWCYILWYCLALTLVLNLVPILVILVDSDYFLNFILV